jgi:hypothetical protein
MKKIMFALLVMVILLCGCWRFTSNISGLESKWGPPAKVVKNNGTTTYYWAFEEGYYSTAWRTYEFVCDSEGKIISKRSYPTQPGLK